MKKWLTKVGKFRVEHVEFEDSGDLLASAYKVRKGVQHTTEGTNVEGALSAYRAKRCAPTFTVGRDTRRRVRILQHHPLGHSARALMNASGGVETNRVCLAQIELVAISPQGKWLPDPQVTAALAALYHALHVEAGIPYVRVVNPTRNGKTWDTMAGWYGHVDVPENDHVDPRLLDYPKLFDAAKALGVVRVPVKTKPRKKPAVLAPGTAIMRLRARKAPPAPLCFHE